MTATLRNTTDLTAEQTERYIRTMGCTPAELLPIVERAARFTRGDARLDVAMSILSDSQETMQRDPVLAQMLVNRAKFLIDCANGMEG